jgi:hypothetical protein
MSGQWRVYTNPDPDRGHGGLPGPVDTHDGVAREPDRFVHPDSWPTREAAQEALDHMAWCVLPYMCCRCLKARKTAAGTGLPSGWTSRSVPGGIDLRCADCGEPIDDQPE